MEEQQNAPLEEQQKVEQTPPPSHTKLIIGVVVVFALIVAGSAGAYFILQQKVQLFDSTPPPTPVDKDLQSSQELIDLTQQPPVKFIEIGKEYHWANSPVEINGKLAYRARSDEQTRLVVYDGQEIGTEYDYADEIVDLDGKLGYRGGYLGGKVGNFFIVYDNKEYGTEYSFANGAAIVNGKIAYWANQGLGGEQIVVYDGQEIEVEHRIINIFEFDDKLAYEVVDGKNKTFYFVDGKEFGKEYDGVFGLIDIGGKPAYTAKKDDQTFIVYDGQELKNEYDSVGTPIDIGGNLAHKAKKDGQNFIVYDGQEFGKEYDQIREILEFNNKLAFVALDDNKIFIVYDGKKVENTEGEFFNGSNYFRIDNPIWVDGKIAFISGFNETTGGYASVYVNYGGQKVGEEFKEITSIVSVDGKLVMSVFDQDGNGFIVSEE